jgi:alkylation response protein AidB-like acyl-CoA dehydrogenase
MGHPAELVRRWSEARVLELLTQRVVAGGGGPAASALAKLSWGRLEQAATNAIADSSGLGAVGGEAESAAYRFLLARQATIGAGTSEVLRNVIAEQALGLPREVLARDVESSNDKTNQALGGARGRP